MRRQGSLVCLVALCVPLATSLPSCGHATAGASNGGQLAVGGSIGGSSLSGGSSSVSPGFGGAPATGGSGLVIAAGGRQMVRPEDYSGPRPTPSVFVDLCPGLEPVGWVYCVNYDDLALASGLPELLVPGGLAALGSPDDWRCPSLSELNFQECAVSEGCCATVGRCGPIAVRAPGDFDASSGGAPAGEPSADGGGGANGGAGGRALSTQACCYYVELACGV